jgi:hypothetical protein
MRPCGPTKGAGERPCGRAVGWRGPCTHDHELSVIDKKGGGQRECADCSGTRPFVKGEARERGR